MTEAGHKRVIPFWPEALIIGGIIFCLLGAVWLLLPDIAAFGLRFEPTRGFSKTALEWLGPRATGAVFREHEYWSANEWFDLVGANMRLAEPNPLLRARLVRSLGDVNCRGRHDWTPLHFAARGGHDDIAELLISRGADVNAKDDCDMTPLHCAARDGRRAISELLISEGADVNASYHTGMTPLHFAASWGHGDVAELLVSKGANVNAKNDSGSTPLHFATQQDAHDSDEMLNSTGADLNLGDSPGRTAHLRGGKDHIDIAALLVSNGADVNAKNDDSWTPLHSAAMCPRGQAAELLISKGADVNASDVSGTTPLHEAARWGHRETAELLISRAADVNAKDDCDMTPLHWAAQCGRCQVVELLISKGANVNAKDDIDRTPLSCAGSQGYSDVAELLRKHGAKTSSAGSGQAGKELEPSSAGAAPDKGEEKTGEAGAAGRRLQGNRASPYVAWDQASLIKWASEHLLKGFQPDPMLTERLALLAEVRALLHELHSYDLAAPPHRTDGRHDFQDAEWPLMALCYTGYALCNFAEAWPETREEFEKETASILEAVTRPAVSGFMKDHFGEPFPAHGEIAHSAVFLHGHWLYLAVRYKEVFGSDNFDALARRVARALARDFEKHGILASYRGMHYLSDNCPALAALRRYDAVFGDSLSKEPVRKFITAMRRHYLDEATGLMASYVDPTGARAPEEPRGIAVMYALTFLPDIDREFAKEQWSRAREHLVREVPWIIKRLAAGLPFAEQVAEYGEGMWVCLEHPDIKGLTDTQRNLADGDSGPVLFGVGASASAFLIAAARQNGEESLARGTEGLAVIAGNPRWIEDRLYYTNMFHPVGQAVVLYGKSLRFVPTRDAAKTSSAGSGQAGKELEPSSPETTPDKGEGAGGER